MALRPSPFGYRFRRTCSPAKLGLAPEALSRAFSMLRRSGVIVKGRVIEFRDRQALEEF